MTFPFWFVFSIHFRRMLASRSTLAVLLLGLASTSALSAQDGSPDRQLVSASDPRAFFPEHYFPGLEPLLRESVTQSPNAVFQQARMEETEGQIERAETQYHWQVNAYGRYVGGYEMREDIDNGVRQLVYTNVIGRRPLYHWGKLDARKDQAEAQRALASADVGLALQDHLLQVREVYLRALAAKERVQLADNSLEIARKALDGYERLYDAGQVSEAQFLELQIQYQEAEELQVSARREYAYRMNQLKQLVGREDVEAQVQATDFPEIELWSQETIEEWGERIRSGELLGDLTEQRYDAMRETEEKNIYIAKRTYLPDVNLEVGLNNDRLEDINSDDNVMRTYAYGGVSIDWTIWDGWRAKADERIARAKLRRLEMEERLKRRQNANQIDSLVEELNFNRMQIDSRQRRADLLQRQLQLADELGDRSEMTSLDRLRTQLNYERQLQDVRDLRINYLLNLAKLGLLAFNDPILPES
ncbi:MAG: outer membrane efflux protein [Puniceicoccaceae bacterium 5H]|nr:MAG: outer membrane efflux protein [Puniceicoccaceae bacterium 5H]